MKNVKNQIGLVIILLTLFAYNPTESKDNTESNSEKVNIYYFHSTNRCPTCNAVEFESQSLIQEKFASENKDGKIKFTAINIEDKANKKLVKKYKVSFSTLLIVNSSGEKVNFTNIAFQYAKTNPERYRELLTSEILKLQ